MTPGGGEIDFLKDGVVLVCELTSTRSTVSGRGVSSSPNAYIIVVTAESEEKERLRQLIDGAVEIVEFNLY
jgi:hypothetical protein